MRKVKWAAFRYSFILLGVSKYRVNEIRTLTLEHFLQFRDKRVLQVYQGKENKYPSVLLSQEGFIVLYELEEETNQVTSLTPPKVLAFR